MNLSEFVAKVNAGMDVVENTRNILQEIKSIDSKHHYMNNVCDNLAISLAEGCSSEGRLAGVPVSVKDCLCVKGVESTAGSAVLKGYKPVFHATAVQKVIDAGGVIVGKTAQDEFGFGTFCTNVGNGFPVPTNPVDEGRVCGGSSGGSAGITAAADFAHASIAESTGGSIACPASFCGVVGITPTYGRVSRYGLMDYANSLDKIGVMGKTVADATALLEVISGFDSKDSTSVDKEKNFASYLEKGDGLDVGMISEFFGEGCDPAVGELVKSKVSGAGSVSLPLTSKYSLPTYYLLAMCEASTNLAKYSGMRYGAHGQLEGGFNEYFTKVRSDSFGAEAKRRIIIGTFARMAGYRDAYYIKALKVRTKIIQEYQKMFEKHDVLVCPTMPVVAPKFSEVEKMTPMQQYMMDIITVGPNLAGLPHMTINVGSHDGMPVGLMLVANHFEEGKMIQMASFLEKGGKV